MSKKSEDPNLFMHAVGLALTTWGRVEVAHCAVFCRVASGTVSNEALERAYWAISSFDGRLKMVNAAISHAFSQHAEYLETWTDLHRALESKNKIRNKIAHGSVVPLSVPDADSGHLEVKFVPYFWSNLENLMTKNGNLDVGFSLKDIRDFSDAFSLVEARLWRLHDIYLKEQIAPRSTKRFDGSDELPQTHFPKLEQ